MNGVGYDVGQMLLGELYVICSGCMVELYYIGDLLVCEGIDDQMVVIQWCDFYWWGWNVKDLCVIVYYIVDEWYFEVDVGIFVYFDDFIKVYYQCFFLYIDDIQ